jgi:DNA-binding GntR family transcriptional regulator
MGARRLIETAALASAPDPVTLRAELAALVDAQRVAVTERETWIARDREFPAGDRHLNGEPSSVTFCESLWDRLLTIGLAVLNRLESRELDVLDEHDAIVESPAADDRAGAAHALEQHVENALSGPLSRRP